MAMKAHNDSSVTKLAKYWVELAGPATSCVLTISCAIHAFEGMQLDSHHSPHTQEDQVVEEEFPSDSALLSGTRLEQFTPLHVHWSFDSSSGRLRVELS